MKLKLMADAHLQGAIPTAESPAARRWLIVEAFFKLIAAGPLFFVSAWLLMIFAGVVGAEVGIHPFGYLTAMVVTIALWLTLAPAIGAVGRAHGKSRK
jgi:hypothetical protein